MGNRPGKFMTEYREDFRPNEAARVHTINGGVDIIIRGIADKDGKKEITYEVCGSDNRSELELSSRDGFANVAQREVFFAIRNSPSSPKGRVTLDFFWPEVRKYQITKVDYDSVA